MTLVMWFDHAAWREQAACRGLDTNMFFPPRGGRVDRAKDVCRTCPVINECRAYVNAMPRIGTRPVPGIWGGQSERERRLGKPSSGWQPNPPWEEREPELAEWALALLADGATITAVANEIGVTRDTIRHLVARRRRNEAA